MLILLILFFIVYFYYLFLFHRGLSRDTKPLNFEKHTVSVVVAARNEENNISRLLTGLVNQSYSEKLFEVIIVDDRSEDRTADIVKKFAEKWNNIRYLRIDTVPDGISPKKNALGTAIANAKGEIILLTDADCLISKYWIEAMVSNYLPEVAVVAGFSRIDVQNWSKSSLLHKFEYFDFLVLFFAAAGAILSGKAFSCSNQNFSYRKSAFLEVGGFEKIKHLISGDDVNLLQLFRKQGFRITFSMNPHSFIYTKAITSWKQLFNQRSRWASNYRWQIRLNIELFIYLLVVFALNLGIIAAFFFAWKQALFFVLLKGLVEFLFIKSNFHRFEYDSKRLAFFPIWFLFSPFYMFIVAILGSFGIFKWKVR